MNGGAHHAGARFDTTKARMVCPRHQKAAPPNDRLEVKDRARTLLAIVETHRRDTHFLYLLSLLKPQDHGLDS